MNKIIGIILALTLVLIASTAFAGGVCFWKDCPQPGDVTKSGYSLSTGEPYETPLLQLIPNINLNGETDYVWRKAEHGGNGFGVGIGTTLAIIKGVINIDGKYVKMIETEDVEGEASGDDLVGLGAALNIFDTIKLLSGDIVIPETISANIGVQGLFDAKHGTICPGVYAQIKYIF